MIWVYAPWPRCGTSMTMAMLTAGGLVPIRDDEPGGSESHPVGAFQHSQVMKGDSAAVLAANAHPRACVKVFSRQVLDLTDAGIYPAQVIALARPHAEFEASWDRALKGMNTVRDEEYLGLLAEDATERLRAAGIPILDVAYHDVVDRPLDAAEHIAQFVGDLDVTAMAAVPDRRYRHFGGAAGHSA